MSSIPASRFEPLFLQSIRMIDVRAPIEFQTGAAPSAVNLPLLTDEERHQVGLTYRHQGQEAAIELGHRLVNGEVREKRLAAWIQEFKLHPEAVIYCFRGGLRSRTVQAWLRDQGLDRPLIDGGYKALRRFLLQTLPASVQQLDLRVVSGRSGSGKTAYLRKSGQPFLDLEALAEHRGSVFGKRETPQPTQADFENRVAVELLKLSKLNVPVLIENESRLIGQRVLPEALFLKMQMSPKIFLEVSFEERIENIFKDYILNSSLGLRNDAGKFTEFRVSVQKISRKLGGLRTQEILRDLDASERDFFMHQSLDSNRVWIAKLLQWYYDPFYD